VPEFFQAFFIFLSVPPTTHKPDFLHTVNRLLALIHLQKFRSSTSTTAASNNDNDDNNSNDDPMNQPRLLYNVNHDIIFMRNSGKGDVLSED
jgi:hypothetical protein